MEFLRSRNKEIYMRIFDSHAHYDDDRYEENRDSLIKEMMERGVEHIVNCGADHASLKATLELSRKYPIFHAALGIHPSDADEYTEDVEKELRDYLSSENVVAIGEIGLDYYWEENPSKEMQMDILKRQYALAREFNKSVILHVRDAYGDMMEYLRDNSDVPAVLHSFSGSPEIAREAVALGYHIGVGGVVTFKNSKKLPEVIRETPIERILTETDAPYLTPVPYRGKDNRSDYIEYVVRKIAEIKDMNVNEASEILYANSMRFFGLDGK